MRRSHSSASRSNHLVPLAIGVANAPDALCQWVVCGGRTRDVIDGRIACPLTGTAVSLDECIGCHCLMACSGERDSVTDCAIGELN